MAELWSTIILEPVLNSLIALTTVLWDNFGLAIIVLTVVVRLILFPLTVRQTQSTKAMQLLQPRIQELQKKYAKDQRKLQQEMMKVYKEAGINPLGCLWPMLIQLPIWIALYQSIMQAMAATPESLLSLSQHLYHWAAVGQAVPLNDHFLWLRLSQNGDIILAVLVGGTMWIQQKMVTPPPADPRQQTMTSMTTLMMPLMFGFFTLSFPSGLALYWVVSNIIGIIIQYFVSGGWGYLRAPSVPKQAAPPQKPSLPQKPMSAEQQSKVLKQASEQSKTIKQASEEKKRGLFGR
jgi:YidC/Oxa1 family membrane protein insertase